MASRTKTELLTTITTDFANQSSEGITPTTLRNFFTDLVDSMIVRSDELDSIPLFGYKISAGTLWNDGGTWKFLSDSSNLAVNVGSTITVDTQKISFDAGVSPVKFISYGAHTNEDFKAYDVLVKINGTAIEIYPLLMGPKTEFAHLEYDGTNWGLLAGAQSTMTLSSETANSITLGHTDCGFNPASITPRVAARDVYTSSSIDASSTTLNLADATGNAYTPSSGDRISITRQSATVGKAITVDPALLTNANGRISFFIIYEA